MGKVRVRLVAVDVTAAVGSPEADGLGSTDFVVSERILDSGCDQ